MFVIMDEDGNLYGADGSYNIFELSAPKSRDGVWKYHQLYTLNGNSEAGALKEWFWTPWETSTGQPSWAAT